MLSKELAVQILLQRWEKQSQSGGVEGDTRGKMQPSLQAHMKASKAR